MYFIANKLCFSLSSKANVNSVSVNQFVSDFNQSDELNDNLNEPKLNFKKMQPIDEILEKLIKSTKLKSNSKRKNYFLLK